MADPTSRRARWASNLVTVFVRGEALRKTALCAEVLAEARELVSTRRNSPTLGALIARAHELLDEVDEMLIALDPPNDTQAFAVAAEAHRQLEYIEAASTAMRRFGQAESK